MYLISVGKRIWSEIQIGHSREGGNPFKLYMDPRLQGELRSKREHPGVDEDNEH